jgi:hypothetical protein
VRPGATWCEMGSRTGAALSHSPAPPVFDSIDVNLSLYANYLLQGMHDLDQIALRFHHLVDVLVRHRSKAQATVFTRLTTSHSAPIARTIAKGLFVYWVRGPASQCDVVRELKR